MSKDKECKCGGNCTCKKSIDFLVSDMDNWLNDLESKKQPKACSIDDEDCEACGS